MGYEGTSTVCNTTCTVITAVQFTETCKPLEKTYGLSGSIRGNSGFEISLEMCWIKKHIFEWFSLMNSLNPQLCSPPFLAIINSLTFCSVGNNQDVEDWISDCLQWTDSCLIWLKQNVVPLAIFFLLVAVNCVVFQLGGFGRHNTVCLTQSKETTLSPLDATRPFGSVSHTYLHLEQSVLKSIRNVDQC